MKRILLILSVFMIFSEVRPTDDTPENIVASIDDIPIEADRIAAIESLALEAISAGTICINNFLPSYCANFTLLHYFADKSKNEEFFSALIAKGADVNAVCEEDKYDKFLAINLSEKDPKIKHAYDQRMKSNEESGIITGCTPLYHAVWASNLEAAQILINKGADVNIAFTHTGTTLLHIAICRKDWEMVSLLLTNGAKLSAFDINGNTSLHELICAKSQTKKSDYIASRLIALTDDYNINAQNVCGLTPLCIALYKGHRNIVIMLCQRLKITPPEFVGFYKEDFKPRTREKTPASPRPSDAGISPAARITGFPDYVLRATGLL